MKLQSLKKLAGTISVTLLIAGLTSCSKPFGDEAQFAVIDGKSYIHGEYQSFSTMQYNHPDLAREGFFPGKRHTSTLFIETELLYDEAKEYEAQVVGTTEWNWKKNFLLGQFFQRNIIQVNLGATRKQLEDYFKKNKGTFLFDGSETADTSFSTHFLSVVDRRFLDVYPPTEDFAAGNPVSGKKALESKWIELQKTRRIIFFRDVYYKETYGTEYPTDINDVFGEGKIITQADLDIISKWLPKTTRERLNETKTRDEIIGYMVGWKLFGEKAKSLAINTTPRFKQLDNYFTRYELVRYYLNNILTDKLSADISDVNKDNLRYAFWDETGVVEDITDSSRFNELAMSIVKKKTNSALLKYISQKRAEKGVSLTHKDYKDKMGQNSERLFFQADSLAGIGNRDFAKQKYRELIKNFPYSKEGSEAHRALAMLHSDDGSYRNAITEYRNYLMLSESNEEWCKVYFMIGYTYGENLGKLDLAAKSYQWILKNQPSCDLIDDAEFMYLHLGEAMVDVDELQAENARQGRNQIN